MRSGGAESLRDSFAASNFPLDEFAAEIEAMHGEDVDYCISGLCHGDGFRDEKVLIGNIDEEDCAAIRAASDRDEKLARLIDGGRFSPVYWSAAGSDPVSGLARGISCGLLVPCADNAGRIYIIEYLAKKELSELERSKLVTDTLLAFMAMQHAANLPPAAQASALSRKELECLRWAADGKTSSEIAIITGLSEHTVNHYLIFACNKLNAVNRAHAVAKAIRAGII